MAICLVDQNVCISEPKLIYYSFFFSFFLSFTRSMNLYENNVDSFRLKAGNLENENRTHSQFNILIGLNTSPAAQRMRTSIYSGMFTAGHAMGRRCHHLHRACAPYAFTMPIKLGRGNFYPSPKMGSSRMRWRRWRSGQFERFSFFYSWINLLHSTSGICFLYFARAGKIKLPNWKARIKGDLTGIISYYVFTGHLSYWNEIMVAIK